jgi:hypothetical protein
MKHDVISPLLFTALDAHGGLERWRERVGLSSSMSISGELRRKKGMPATATPLRVTTDFHRQWTRMEHFGEADWTMIWTPERVQIENDDWEPIAVREQPRKAFEGHDFDTPWDILHLAYFSGYEMWTYNALPFVLAEPGYAVREIDPILEGGQLLRGLRARFPIGVHTHSAEQRFYFSSDGLLRRHDYDVDVVGGARAAQFLSDYVEVDGFQLPRTRRVHPRDRDGLVQRDTVLVAIDAADFSLS